MQRTLRSVPPALVLAFAAFFACSAAPSKKIELQPSDVFPGVIAEVTWTFASICAKCRPAWVTFDSDDNIDEALARVTIVDRWAEVHYDEGRLTEIARRYGRASVWGVFAHELGHYAVTRTTDIDPGHTAELLADRWAGCAMAVAGLSSVPFEALLWDIARFPTETHPEAALRLDHVREGWINCLPYKREEVPNHENDDRFEFCGAAVQPWVCRG